MWERDACACTSKYIWCCLFSFYLNQCWGLFLSEQVIVLRHLIYSEISKWQKMLHLSAPEKSILPTYKLFFHICYFLHHALFAPILSSCDRFCEQMCSSFLGNCFTGSTSLEACQVRKSSLFAAVTFTKAFLYMWNVCMFFSFLLFFRFLFLSLWNILWLLFITVYKSV